jgi:Domain of unknown function (DUF4407)
MQSLTLYFQRFRRFVLALSGVHIETLELVPSERPRFESLGWSILITSGLAVVSMWFALASALNVNGIVALPIALCWGLVIMGIDRWLVTSMPVDNNRKLALAAPRVVLALLLGTLISTPLVLRIFQTEINAQIVTMQQGNYNAFLKQQQGSQVAQQVSTYSKELNNLNTIINSQGASTGNTSTDPELVSYNNQLTGLQKQLATWTLAQSQDLKEYSCQKYGGANCPKAGVGPAAKASLASYNQATVQVKKVQGEVNQLQQDIAARTKELSSSSKVDQQNRYQEALTQRPVVQQEYNTAVQRQNQLQAVFYAQNQASHGILTKLEALSQLSDSNLTVAVARWLLFLLFLVIECLPVTVKLLQKPSGYEAALARAKLAESRDVEEYYSEYGGLRPDHPAAAYAPVVGGQAPARPSAVSSGPVSSGPASPGPASESRQERRQRRQAQDARAASDVLAVWNHTKVMPRVVGDPADEVSTRLIDHQARGEGAFDLPPAENDLREGASAWAQPASDSRADDPRSGGDERGRGWGRPDDGPRRDASGWDQATADIAAMWTRLDPRAAGTRVDHDPDGDADEPRADARRWPGADAYQPEPVPRHGQASHGQPSHEQGQSLHDALSDMDDDASLSPRTDGGTGGGTGGMPLNWDDE